MKKEDFKVGDKIVDVSSWKQGKATVTEITERGFKYKLEKRHYFGSRYGWSEEGECYLVSPDEYDTKWLQGICNWRK